MKQLGNLAVICAQRPELLMQLRGGLVLVGLVGRKLFDGLTVVLTTAVTVTAGILRIPRFR